MYDNNFLGKNNFIWFNGVVEDRQDPQKLGRLRVRCVGIHTDNKEELPTADLPWSQLIHPITSSGISGLGSSPIQRQCVLASPYRYAWGGWSRKSADPAGKQNARKTNCLRTPYQPFYPSADIPGLGTEIHAHRHIQ